MKRLIPFIIFACFFCSVALSQAPPPNAPVMTFTTTKDKVIFQYGLNSVDSKIWVESPIGTFVEKIGTPPNGNDTISVSDGFLRIYGDILIFSSMNNSLKSMEIGATDVLVLLGVDGEDFDSLDVSSVSSLAHLWCRNMSLKKIKFSSNNSNISELKVIRCHTPSLDLNLLPNLTYLEIRNSFLETIDLINNPLLQTLICDTNLIESIDLSQNAALTTLNCSSNKLENLNLAQIQV